jgi:hypothetical protein
MEPQNPLNGMLQSGHVFLHELVQPPNQSFLRHCPDLIDNGDNLSAAQSDLNQKWRMRCWGG